MITPALALLLVAELGAANTSNAASRPVVAVFDVEASSAELSSASQDALADYLVARLAESTFRCVPRAELRKRIEESKKDSYAPCVEEGCQIELGKELAAEKTLSTKVLRLGARCQLTSVLYDLRTAATETAATREAACTEPALLEAAREIADQLTGKKVAVEARVTPPAVRAPAEETRPEAPVRAEASAPTFVTCALDSGSPGILGWCSSGTFYGPIHLGTIIFAGTARSFGGFAQTAVINRVGDSFYGVVQGGLASFVGHDFYGAAEVGAVNVVGGNFVGFVQGGGYNDVGGTFTGIQAGGVNRAKRVQGLQIGVLNFAGELHGLQLGLLNFADNGILGVLPIFNAGF